MSVDSDDELCPVCGCCIDEDTENELFQISSMN